MYTCILAYVAMFSKMKYTIKDIKSDIYKYIYIFTLSVLVLVLW